jgi:hypothetical protein
VTVNVGVTQRNMRRYAAIVLRGTQSLKRLREVDQIPPMKLEHLRNRLRTNRARCGRRLVGGRSPRFTGGCGTTGSTDGSGHCSVLVNAVAPLRLLDTQKIETPLARALCEGRFGLSFSTD